MGRLKNEAKVLEAEVAKPYGYTDIPLKYLLKADWNYKTDDDAIKEKLKANILKNGQIENLIVRELENGCYEIVNGNHRFDVLKELEIKEAHVFNFGKIDLEDAIRIAVETNETKFESDQIKLAGVVKQLQAKYNLEELALTLPYTDIQLQNYIKMTDFDFSDYSKTSTKEVNFTVDNSKITFIITVDKSEAMIQESLQEICQSYKTAVMEIK